MSPIPSSKPTRSFAGQNKPWASSHGTYMRWAPPITAPAILTRRSSGWRSRTPGIQFQFERRRKDVQNRLVLAMAHQRLGHAHTHVPCWPKWRATWRHRAAKTDGAVSLQTPDWLALQLLRSEAEALVLYDPVFPADLFAKRP